MKSTDDRSLIPVPIAADAASDYIRTIPTTQATAGDGSVSIDLGLPPECAISSTAGGKRPEMKDVNGVYNLLSSSIRSLQAYYGIFSSTFATGIGGYPNQAVVQDSSGLFWISTADDNTTTPGATGASWKSFFDGYATETYANGTFVAGDTGYEIHPNGYIRQWGKYDSGSGGLATVVFPIPFPNAAFGANVGENNALSTWTANHPVFHGHYGLSQNSMVVVTRGIDSSSSTGWGPQESTGDWEAWGN